MERNLDAFQDHFWGIEKQEPSLFPYPSNPDKRGPHPAEGTLWHLVAVRNRGLLRLTVNLLSHALPTVMEDAAAGSGDFLNFALIVLWKILKIDYAAFAGGVTKWRDSLDRRATYEQRGSDDFVRGQCAKPENFSWRKWQQVWQSNHVYIFIRML